MGGKVGLNTLVGGSCFHLSFDELNTVVPVNYCVDVSLLYTSYSKAKQAVHSDG